MTLVSSWWFRFLWRDRWSKVLWKYGSWFAFHCIFLRKGRTSFQSMIWTLSAFRSHKYWLTYCVAWVILVIFIFAESGVFRPGATHSLACMMGFSSALGVVIPFPVCFYQYFDTTHAAILNPDLTWPLLKCWYDATSIWLTGMVRHPGRKSGVHRCATCHFSWRESSFICCGRNYIWRCIF